MIPLRCWWFGHEQHPQDSAPVEEARCMHCGDYVSYADRVGDTRHLRLVDALNRFKWKWLERTKPCEVCGQRRVCAPECDRIPF